MIQGRVNDGLEAVVGLVIRGSSGRAREIEAIVDTGFNGFLTLPPTLVAELDLPILRKGLGFLADGSEVRFNVHTVVVEWNARRRYIGADATGRRPLVGMQLLRGHSLNVEVDVEGRVVIDEQN